MSADVIEFSEVFSVVKGALNSGRLRLQKDKITFKSNKTGKVEQISAADVNSVHWMKSARGFEMKLMDKEGHSRKYMGFKEADYERLSDHVSKNYALSLDEIERSVNGWNWGKARFNGSLMSFEVDKKLAFEISLSDVAQTTAGKNEVSLEFHQTEEAPVSLMEMRFFVPNSADAEVDAVKEFHENVLAKADILQVTGDAIVTFDEVTLLTPRGRYTMKVYQSFMQLHGKTYDYKIPFTTIVRLFLLPQQDNRQMSFVVSLDPPIRQGQTRYHFLVFAFSTDDLVDVNLHLSQEELNEKYGKHKLEQEMSGPMFEIVSRIMKAVVGRKIIVPGTFKSPSGAHCITCSFKASPGLLYPLERGFMFVYKPTIYVRYDEVTCVNFARSITSTTKSFDFEVEAKNGNVYSFVGIDKEEYTRLFDFVNGKRLRIKNKGIKNQPALAADSDMSGSDDEHDAYLAAVKAEGEERGNDDDSDMSSDDQDFVAVSSSDVGLEYDSSASESSGSSDGASGGEMRPKKSKFELKKTRKETPVKPKKKKKKEHEEKTKEKKEKAKKPRKEKKAKDPTRPKRPMSAYMLWLNDTREKIKKQNPGAAVTEIAKIGGSMWKEISQSKKEEYEKKAAELKKKYQSAIKEWERGKRDSSHSSPSKKPAASASAPSGAYKSQEFVESSSGSSGSDED